MSEIRDAVIIGSRPVARVAAAEFGRRVAESLHHVAHGCHLAPADADGAGRGGRGPAGDVVHVAQAEGRIRWRRG
ncbi:hypothetical protein ACWD04_11995 [Streptomyces sp. NPDC002911]